MWLELAYAIALTDFWQRIRRSGDARSREAMIALLEVVSVAAVDDHQRALRQAPGRGALGEEDASPWGERTESIRDEDWAAVQDIISRRRGELRVRVVEPAQRNNGRRSS